MKNSTQEFENPFGHYSVERQVIWSVLFLFISIVGAVGNSIVIWIVLSTKSMRSVTNLFVVNLAVTDAMVAILNISLSASYNIFRYWYFGEAMCKISQFVGSLSICVSVLTLLAIAIERYLVIMKPLKPRMSKRTTVAIVVTIWSVAAAISLPTLIYVKLGVGENNNLCYSVMSDVIDSEVDMELVYKIVIMIFTFFVPLIPMAVLYYRIGRELWGSKTIGEDSNQQTDNVQKKRKVVKMLIVVVSVFALCWLPFHIYFIIESCNPLIMLNPVVQEVQLFVFWLAMSNSMYNPIIYCWMNERYRDGFKRVFRCCPFVHFENTDRSNNVDRLLPQSSTSNAKPTITIRSQ